MALLGQDLAFELGDENGLPPPVLVSIAPTTATTAGGVAVTLTGTGFQPTSTVMFGDVQATITGFSAFVLEVLLPALAPGVYDVFVTNPSGDQGTLAAAFSVTALSPAPQITSITPVSGSVVGGTNVTIIGTNFVAPVAVRFDISSGTIISVTDTQIVVSTPAHASGLLAVSVTNPDGQRAIAQGAFSYLALPPVPHAAPTVTSVTPNTGSYVGGTLVTIAGTDFQQGARAYFGSVEADVITVSATEIQASTLGQAASVVDVRVTNPDQQSDTLVGAFTFTAPPVPGDVGTPSLTKTILSSPLAAELSVPTARLLAAPSFAVLGSVVQVDGRQSSDPDQADLVHSFVFISTPIGSNVAQEGFKTSATQAGLATFAPDIVGKYEIGLRVANGLYESALTTQMVDVRAILTPHARGMVPDGKFIWQYIRDAWAQVEGKELFETLWSGLIQICGAELLKLYQVDYNKSIRDIQDLYQRRWLSYEPKLEIVDEDASFLLGGHLAGRDAYIVEPDVVLLPSADPADLFVGRVIVVGGISSTILRTASTPDGVLITVELPCFVKGLRGLFWRIPHMLKSLSQDFEALGVSPGDVLMASVGVGVGISADVPLQVVAVDRSLVGFVLTDEPLREGAIPELPSAFLSNLGAALGLDDWQGYADAARGVYFRRSYEGVELGSSSPLQLLRQVFTLTPKHIVRNSCLPVDADLRSVPALQEFIDYPELVERGGQVYQLRRGQEFLLQRTPVVASENSQYIVDGDEVDLGHLTFTTGSKRVEAEGGEFLDRSVRPGDQLLLDSPITVNGAYTVVQVLNQKSLLLDKPIPRTGSNTFISAAVRLKRGRAGHYLRFIPGFFSTKNRAPDRLWAEVSFFDNGTNIENNFGILVSLTREDLDKVQSQASYRQAVAGLMYAYVKGPKVDKVRLGASLLLGLPFAEVRGIIRSIEEDYRRDEQGNPSQGRVLVEDVDASGTPQGITRVYTYPVDPLSELSGIDDNPATNLPYQVGDLVESFSCLAKGVRITDFRDENSFVGSATSLLQQFHTLRVSVNDSLFSARELTLVSQFLKRITPKYLALVLTSLTEVADQVGDSIHGEILETTKLKIRIQAPTIMDDAGLSFAAGTIFDARTVRGIRTVYWNDGLYAIRRAGSDLSYVYGAGSPLTVPSGGLLDSKTGEVFESPLCRINDVLVILSGVNSGHYTITSVTDTVLGLSFLDGGGRLTNATGQRYAILRPARELVRSGSDASSAANGTKIRVASGALRTDAVAPGDLVLLDTAGTPTAHQVRQVLEHTPGNGVWDDLDVTPNTPSTLSGVSFKVYRETFFSSPSVTSYTVTANGTNTLTCTDGTLALLLKAGDSLLFTGRTDLLEALVLDPVNLWVTPPIPAGSYPVKIIRNGKISATGVPFGFRNVRDNVLAALASGTANASTVSSNTTVTFSTFHPSTGGIRPGDLLEVRSGASASVDVGYGAGRYPVVEVSSTTVKTSRNLTSTGSVTWALLRRV